MNRNFGSFKDIEYQVGGSVSADPEADIQGPNLPPIMGSPVAPSAITADSLGHVSPGRERPSPKMYAEQTASKRRMKQLPPTSGLGPITGGLLSGARPQGGASPEGQPGPDMGDRWMGEIWQQISPAEGLQGQGEILRGTGYAEGGSVDDLMSIYNQTMSDLESGGIGYAHGGAVEQSQEIASMGRGGDSMLMHINPAELEGLQSLLGPVSVNPDTGNLEAWGWLVPLIMAAVGTVGAGAASDWEAGPMIMGGLAGLTLGAAAAPAAAATTATGASLSSAPVLGTLPASLGGGTIGGALAPGAGVLAQGAGGGVLASSLAPGAGVLAQGAGGGLLAGSLTPAQLAAGVPGTMSAAGSGSGGLSSLFGGKMDSQGMIEKGLGMVQQSGQPQPQQQSRQPAPLGLDAPPKRQPSRGQLPGGQILRPPRRRRPGTGGGSGRLGNVLRT